MGRLLTLLRRKGEFSPLDLPGLALWLDASDTTTITHDTGAVSQWDDKSGNARNVVQATADAQPATGTRTINGLNVLDFTDDFLTDTLVTLAQPYTVFLVAEFDESGKTAPSVITERTAFRPRFGIVDTTSFRIEANTNTVIKTDLAFGVPHVVGAVLNGASGVASFDGVETSANFGTASLNLVMIGAAGSDPTITAAQIDGAVAEIIVYANALATSDRKAAEAYLARKWGVTLA